MNEAAEFFARECRKALAIAAVAERSGDIDLADVAGAVAGNKLAQAVRLNARDNVIRFPKRAA